MFMDWSRKFPVIALHCAVDVDDYTTDEFWSRNGDHVKELHFESGLLSKEEFIFVTKNTRNLEVLKIEGNNLFKNWVIERFKYERRVRFNNCYDISLARNNILTKDVFDFIMETSPQIRSLNLSNCFHIMNPPERNKFLDHVLDFIRTNVTQIKALNFSNTTTDDLFLDKLGRIENLRLEELHLTFMGSTKNSLYGLPVLIRSQPYLTKIDLTASPCANDIVVKLIANNMPRMKILSLKKCHNLTDNGVREIQKLNMLEVIYIFISIVIVVVTLQFDSNPISSMLFSCVVYSIFSLWKFRIVTQ
jgi:F-box and leucine-rich repeat protein 9